MFRRLLVICAALLVLPASAQASTDEQRLAVDLPGARAAFPTCGERLAVHLHADDIIDAAYPNERGVLGMGRNCEVWIRSGLPRDFFRFTLYHETYHATHCGCEADHSPAMDRAVIEAMRRASAKAKRSRRAHSARQDRNRWQRSGRIPS